MPKDDLKILITAELNRGLSIGEINKSIKKIQSHPSLKSLKLKLDVDQKILKTLTDFNKNMHKVNQTMKNQEASVKDTTQALDKETQQIKQNTQELSKNQKMRQKIIENEKKREIHTTAGNKFDNTTSRRTEFKNGEFAENSETVRNIDYAGAEKQRLAAQNKMLNEAYKMNEQFDKRMEALDKSHFMALKTDRERKEALDKIHYLALKQNRERNLKIKIQLNKEAEALDKSHFMALRDNNKKTEAIEKIHYVALQKNRERDIKYQQDITRQQAKIDDVRRRFSGNLNMGKSLSGFDRELADTKNIGKYNHALKDQDMRLKQIASSASTAKANSIGFGNAMSQALTKFPIWMIAATAFYAPLRAFQDAVTQIIEIDTQLTELMRVSNGQENINKVLSESIRLADELGNKVTQVNEAIIGFSRQGFRGDDLLAIAEVATLMSNVSTLSLEESMSGVTAAMKVFNIEADESIKIVNALNEVDNNFSIETAQLSDSIKKAGGAARAFGVDMESLIGHTTAIGQVTRESGRIIGNSLKTIYSRLTTMQPSIDALAEIGINVKNANGEMKSSTAILEQLAGKWTNLNSEQQQNLGVTLAGRFQLSRFLTLMQQFEQSTLATNTALNSQGSAYRENEQFLKSLQARLNRMANAWTELTLSMGDALLTDGIVLFTESITDLSKGMASVVKSVGLLPPIIGLVSIAIATMNSTMRASVMEKAKAGASATGLAGAYNRLAASASLAGAATRTLSIVLRSIPQVAVFMAIGFAIEKLVSHFAKLREEQRELEIRNKKLTDSWINQREEIDKLLPRFRELTDLRNDSGLNNKQEQEYLDLQNKLGEILPTLVQNLDDKGNSHLFIGDALEREISLLKEREKIERERRVDNANKDFADASDKINKINDQILSKEDNLKSMEDFNKMVDETGKQVKKNTEEQFRVVREEIIQLMEERNRGLTLLPEGFNSAITDMLWVDGVEISNQVKDAVSIISKELDVGSMGTSQYTKTLNDVTEAIKLLQSNVDPHFLREFSKETGISASVLKQLKESMVVVKDSTEQLYPVFDEAGNHIGDISGLADKAAEQFLNLNAVWDESEEFIESFTGELATGTNQLIDYINATSDLASAYNTLNDGKQLTLQQIQKLITDYPELISALESEEGQLNLNKDAVEKLMKAKETEFKNGLRIQLEEVNVQEESLRNKLNMYLKEVDAIDKVNEATKALIRTKLAERFIPKTVEEYSALDLSDFERMVSQATAYVDALEGVQSQKGGLEALLASDLSSKGSGGGSSSSSPSSTSSPKPTDTYFTDEFAKSLAELDLALKQSEGRQSKYNETSAEYRNEINTQIDHLKNKQKLMSEEADRLRGLNVDLELQRLELNKNSKEYSKLTEQIDKNNNSIRGLSGGWWDVEGAIDGARDSLEKINEEQQKLFEENHKKWVENLESAADKAIDLIKDHYKDRQKLAQEAIDEELNELERLHEEKTKLLDEDLKKYEEIINAQLRTIDRTSDEEDFSRELSKAEQERLELTQKIHVLSLDDSLEARAKKQELEEELAKKTEEIERMKNRRTKDIRKQNLQDILKNKQKETEEIKSRDQETYETSKTLLEQRKEDETRYWQDKIDNDRYFSELREEGLKGNIKNLTTILQTFALDVEQAMSRMGKTIDENLAKFNLKDLGTRGLENLQDDLEDTIGDLEDAEKNKTPYDSSVNKKDQEQFNNDFKKYIASKIEWYEISQTNKTGAPTNRQEELNKQNQNLRKKYPSLLDYTIDDLVDMGLASYDKGGMTPSWGSSGKLGILHEEEMIFDKIDTSKILKVANIAENIMRNFKTIDFSKMTPNINQPIQPSNSITISIGSVIGDRKGAEQVSNHIIKRLSAKGVI